jgi:hypothetical protein
MWLATMTAMGCADPGGPGTGREGRDAAPRDASGDARPSGDAGPRDAGEGTDAGRADARMPDAGPLAPSCTVMVEPETGTTATTFTGTLALSGGPATMCSYVVDGAAPITIPCASGSMMAGGIGAGMHRIEVTVIGPGGTRTCSDTWTVTGEPAPTCTVEVTPEMGTNATTFTGTLTSLGGGSATACEYAIDGATPVAFPCTVGTSSSASGFGAGTHAIVVTVTGPGGTGMCTDSWTVT